MLVKIFKIEVLRFGEWQEHLGEPHHTMDEAARECLLIMHDLRKNSAGVRIVCTETDEHHQIISTSVPYEKRWDAAAEKHTGAKVAQPIGKHGGRQKVAPSAFLYGGIGLAVVLALAVVGFFMTRGSTQTPAVTAASSQPQSHPQQQSTRSSYIYHPVDQLPKHDQNYIDATAALQSNDGMNRFFKKRPTVIDQASDVIGVLDGLDYMNCSPRDGVKSLLVDVFVDYLARVKAPEDNKIAANDAITTRSKQVHTDLRE